MGVTKTLAYDDMVTITTVKSFYSKDIWVLATYGNIGGRVDAQVLRKRKCKSLVFKTNCVCVCVCVCACV
jgi:hypothetical protein